MPTKPQSDQKPKPSRRNTATTPEGREAQMVDLAYSLAEERMRQGTASAQEVTHFLKLGSSREALEQRRLTREVSLLEAKVEALESQKDMHRLYTEAMAAMTDYKGATPSEVENEA